MDDLRTAYKKKMETALKLTASFTTELDNYNTKSQKVFMQALK